MKHQRILVHGYYGFNNVGDEGILLSILSSLQENGYHPVVVSGNPQKTNEQYSVESISRSQLKDALKTSHALVSGGGSLLQDVTDLTTIPYYLNAMYQAYKQKVPVFFYAQGIGPIKVKAFYPLIKYVLNRCEYISVRDIDSKVFLQKEIQIKKNIDLTIDPVLCMDIPESASLPTKLKVFLKKKPIIFSLRSRPPNDLWAEEISKTIKVLVQQKIPVLLLPFHISYDLHFLYDFFYKALQNEPTVFIVEDLLTVDQYFEVIKNSRLLIGLRLHSLIFAARVNTPFIGIAYDPKITSFLNLYGISSGITTSNLTSQDLLFQINSMLETGVNYQRQLSESNFIVKKSLIDISTVLNQYYEKR